MESLIKYYPYTLAVLTLLWMVGLWAWQKAQEELEHLNNQIGLLHSADLSAGEPAFSTLQD